MNRVLFSSVLLTLLAACSSVPLSPDESAEGGPGATPDNIAEQPLRVPDLSTIRDTPARALSGKFQKVSWSALPGWENDSLDQVWKGFINNCKGLMRPVSGSLAQQARATPRAWQPVCAAAAQSGLTADNASTASVRQFLQTHLQPWRLLDAAGKPARNTVTSYYEPLVHASRSRQGEYQWPLYAAPDDLLTIDLGSVYPELAGKRVRGKVVGKRVVPYDTRAEIAASPDRQPRAIVWVNDPVEAFFLQIQGSGRALLDNGQTIRLAYADHNGRPYVSIGQWLAKKGELPLAQASMQNIKAWARNNPSRVQEMLNANPAMVFFREEAVTDPELGPKGAYGIPLIGQRAVAVDTQFVPLGAPLYLSTQQPASSTPLRRLVFAQDTGAAIKGPARIDYYWGFGDEAGAQAGRMKQQGEVWVLWPKQAGAPLCTMSKESVLVCGSGIAGLAMALGLAKAGFDAALLGPRMAHKTAQKDVYHPRVYAISSSSQALLDGLGVWGMMDASRVTPVETMEVYGDASGVVHLHAWQAAQAALAWIVESSELERVLQQAVQVFGIAWHAEKFQRLESRKVYTDSGRILTPDLLVGADGAKSAVRAAAGISHKSRAYGDQGLVVHLTCELPHQNVALQWFTGDTVLALLPMPDTTEGHQVSMVWSMPDDMAEALLALPETERKQQLEGRLMAASGGRLGKLKVRSPLFGFPLFLESSAMVAPGVALVSDAAHRVHPLAGQGLNLGLGDVQGLLKVLTEKETYRAAGDTRVLHRYRRARAEPILAMSLATDGLHKLFANSMAPVAWGRNMGMQVVDKVPFLKRMLIGGAGR